MIKPGLEIKYTKLFDEMLKIMESSDDPTVNCLVNKVHEFSISSSMLSVVETQATQSEGDYCDTCVAWTA